MKKTPYTFKDLPADHAINIQIRLAGYKPLTLTRQLKANETDRLDVKLESLNSGGVANGGGVTPPPAPSPAPPPPPAVVTTMAEKGTLKVMCVPAAKILVDGTDTGVRTVPPRIASVELSAGKHAVVCETDEGQRSVAKDVMIPAGGTQDYRGRIQ